MTPFRKGVRLILFYFQSKFSAMSLLESWKYVLTVSMERKAKMEETVFQVSGPLRLETYLLHFIIMHIISKLQEMYFELSLRWI